MFDTWSLDGIFFVKRIYMSYCRYWGKLSVSFALRPKRQACIQPDIHANGLDLLCRWVLVLYIGIQEPLLLTLNRRLEAGKQARLYLDDHLFLDHCWSIIMTVESEVRGVVLRISWSKLRLMFLSLMFCTRLAIASTLRRWPTALGPLLY